MLSNGSTWPTSMIKLTDLWASTDPMEVCRHRHVDETSTAPARDGDLAVSSPGQPHRPRINHHVLGKPQYGHPKDSNGVAVSSRNLSSLSAQEDQVNLTTHSRT